MCNFSNNNQSATNNPLDNQQAAPTVLELIKMAAELAAIDNAADTALLYSPIPINGIFHINVGDFNISCSITNNAARGNIDCNCSSMYKQATGQTTQQSQQKSENTTQQPQQKSENTTQQSQQKSENTTQQSQRVNVPCNHRVLYSTIIDFIGSYNKTLIKMDYRSHPNGGVTISVINKGNTSKPFFTENTIDTTRILRQTYEQMYVMSGRDAFFVVIKNDNEIADLISALKAYAEKNKRDIIWVYNI